MIGSLVFAALLGASAPGVLDSGDMRGAMKASKTQPAASSLTGRRFRVAIPFVDGARRDLKTFQSPARYDYRNGELQVTVGLGQLTADNYDQFQRQGLQALPPLQTVFFDSTQLKDEAYFRDYNGRGNNVGEIGVRNITTTYGLAVPYANDQSALPPKFEPLMVYKAHMNSQAYRGMVDGMTLVLEGEVTSPATFCGDYNGELTAKDAAQSTRYRVASHQCFVTARINKATIQSGVGAVLASWGTTKR